MSSDNLIRGLLQNVELNIEQSNSETKLLTKFVDPFSRTLGDVGQRNFTQHGFDTGNQYPIKQLPRRLPFARHEEVVKLFSEMQQNETQNHQPVLGLHLSN